MNSFAKLHPNKDKPRKWVMYKREHSNSMRRTDCKQLDGDGDGDGGCSGSYVQDDASHFVIGFGVFEDAPIENTLKMFDEVIKNHGKPVSILTDCGT